MESRSLLRRIGMVSLSLGLCFGLAGLGEAQEKYPTEIISFISGGRAGDSADMTWRALCSAASKILGQNIVFTSKPGASHSIAMGQIKNSKPDGYTVGNVPSGPMTTQLMQKTPYDYRTDFTFIMQSIGYQHVVVVQASAPWKTIQELIAYAKDNPGKVRMGVLGVGAGQHIAMERLSKKTGVKLNIVPLGQSSVAVTKLLGGHVEAICSDSVWMPNVEAGQLRLLAVGGAYEKRMRQFPDVPTLMELYGINMPNFSSLAGPKGLSSHVVDVLHRAFKKGMEDPDFIKTAESFSVPIVYRGPEEITKTVHEAFAIMSDVIQTMGLREKSK